MKWINWMRQIIEFSLQIIAQMSFILSILAFMYFIVVMVINTYGNENFNDSKKNVFKTETDKIEVAKSELSRRITGFIINIDKNKHESLITGVDFIVEFENTIMVLTKPIFKLPVTAGTSRTLTTINGIYTFEGINIIVFYWSKNLMDLQESIEKISKGLTPSMIYLTETGHLMLYNQSTFSYFMIGRENSRTTTLYDILYVLTVKVSTYTMMIKMKTEILEYNRLKGIHSRSTRMNDFCWYKIKDAVTKEFIRVGTTAIDESSEMKGVGVYIKAIRTESHMITLLEYENEIKKIEVELWKEAIDIESIIGINHSSDRWMFFSKKFVIEGIPHSDVSNKVRKMQTVSVLTSIFLRIVLGQIADIVITYFAPLFIYLVRKQIIRL